ncbi:hypothetical protein SAMN03159343_4118 [Klenkia marina]|uniref:Uncharacterized protein n=2 Tax=Klenkia marina TaxID=1960309 RepID=A0A1G4Z4F4_9ACTN|nr:hypothetical protein SAMN03159343_4118 [Klenkia marina]
MAELTVRIGGDDIALLRRVLGAHGAGAGPAAPHRVVVDAHLAPRKAEIVQLAQVAGIPMLIDPQTYYLQDYQHPGDSWAALPYAEAAIATPADLLNPTRVDQVVATCVEFQLQHGASAILAPYVHIESATDGWLQVQLALWAATHRYLAAQQIHVPVIAVVAMGWRLLHRPTWPAVIEPLATGVEALGVQEIALAASKVDQGAHPAQRLADYLATMHRLARIAPVTAWQQGVLGDVSVAGGAAGYETGIGRRERCDLRVAMTNRRTAPDPNAPRGPRGVFIRQLNRSVPKRTVVAISTDRRLMARVICPDPGCCPMGRESLLGDARTHALISRKTSLLQQQRISRPSWGWNRLAAHADEALDLAARLAATRQRNPAITRIDIGALMATKAVADHHRQALRHRKAA